METMNLPMKVRIKGRKDSLPVTLTLPRVPAQGDLIKFGAGRYKVDRVLFDLTFANAHKQSVTLFLVRLPEQDEEWWSEHV